MQTTGTGLPTKYVQNNFDYFFGSDEKFNKLEDFDGRPEFMLQHKENFKRKEHERVEVNFLSNQGPKELSPISPDMPMMYQDIHYNLESWTIFRLLPQLLHWEKGMIDFHNNVAKGLAVIPDYEKERNPPSLWTYY